MFNSPYAKSGPNNTAPVPTKPSYPNGSDLNTNPGGMYQEAPWNQWGFNGYLGGGGNSPYNGPVGGGFSQNKGPEMPPTVNPGQPGQAAPPQVNAPNPSVPAGPTMPQFVMGGANNPAVNLNGRDNPRRFMQRPSLSPQQMQQLTRGGRRPPANAYTPGDGYIELPPGQVGY